MRLLLTTDVAGGVWTYTEELAAELAGRGNTVSLVSFGGLPRAEHRVWVDAHEDIEFTALPTPLEWAPEPEPGLTRSAAILRELVDGFAPDVVHLNQFFPGGIELGAPKLVVAHSDVVGWWRAVKRVPPPDDGWFRRYRGWVESGLAGADARVAPSAWMAGQAKTIYGCGPVRVVHNGRSARHASPPPPTRSLAVVTAGRLWDEGKGARDLADAAPALSGDAAVIAVGPATHPSGGDDFPTDSPGLDWRGILSTAEVTALLRRSMVYVGTSRYEPFGLAPLEAALAGCALVLTEIPTFVELWGDAALFYPAGDSTALADQARRVLRNASLRRSLADAALERALSRYSVRAMTDAYEALYAELSAGRISSGIRFGER